MNDSSKQWEKWGATEPYYGVLTDEKFRLENINDTREEFFRSGEEFIAEALAGLKQAGSSSIGTNRALDFGCGVGRLTIPLAKHFSGVTGIDISPSMLREAKNNCAAFQISNIEFALGDEELSGLSGNYDFINSYIVFQHIPKSKGYKILDRLLSTVAPGGGAMIHLSLRRETGLSKKIVYWMKWKMPASRIVFNLLQGKALNTPWMEMNEYDLPSILKIFSKYGMHNVLISLEYHGHVLTAKCSAQKIA